MNPAAALEQGALQTCRTQDTAQHRLAVTRSQGKSVPVHTKRRNAGQADRTRDAGKAGVSERRCQA